MRLDVVAGDLIAAANGSVDARQFHAIVLAQLRRVAPCDTTLYLPDSSAEETSTLDRAPRPYSLFWKHKPKYLSEMTRAHEVGVRDGAYIDTEIFGRQERERSIFFNEIIRPQGIRVRLVAHLQFRARMLGTVHLCRHGRGQNFDGRTLDAIRQLAPLVSLTCAALRPAAAPPVGVEGERRLESLTPRELAIAQYVRRGYQNKEIAVLLRLSANTVRNRLVRIYKKVGASNRAALAGLLAARR